MSSDGLRQRLVSKGADGQIVTESRGLSDPKADAPKAVPIALDSGWRCVQVTQLVLVIVVVILLIYGVVVATDIRSMLKDGLPEVNATAASHMPRMDTMARVFKRQP